MMAENCSECRNKSAAENNFFFFSFFSIFFFLVVVSISVVLSSIYKNCRTEMFLFYCMVFLKNWKQQVHCLLLVAVLKNTSLLFGGIYITIDCLILLIPLHLLKKVGERERKKKSKLL